MPLSQTRVLLTTSLGFSTKHATDPLPPLPPHSDVLSSMSVAIGTSDTKFSAAVDKTGRIYVEGAVRSGTPFLTKIGGYDVELSVTGSVILCRQRDQPGIVAGISSLLAESGVNISFMTVCRTAKNEDAIMAIGIDEEPTQEVGAWLDGCWSACQPQAAGLA